MVGRRNRERGSLTVESALLLPVLAALLFGGLEYGWMILKMRQMDAVVEQVARIGASNHGTTAMVRTAADRLLENVGLAETGYRLEVVPENLSPTTLAQGEEISITLSIPYEGLSVTGLARPAPALLPAPAHLVATATGVKRGSR